MGLGSSEISCGETPGQTRKMQEDEMKKIVLSLLMENNAGVLSRIAGLFSRRGYNIDSITAGETTTPGVTRMTVVASGEDEQLVQIKKQLAKLTEVLEIEELPENDSVTRELILLKVRARAEERQQIIAVADVFRAKIVDVAQESLTVELTGNQSKLDAFIKLLENYEILEMARTGIIGVFRGMRSLGQEWD